MSERVLMTGNDAIGEGAIRAGCDCYYGYPITPQNELTAYMARHMPAQGRVFIQAESELAAINMVFGSAVTGMRAMTSSSSPGISLKQEGLSYLAAAQIPAVVVNVQRGGPGLGNIAPSQADYFQATKGGGHGDYHLIVLAPDSIQEMHDLTILAFALSDKWRNPVMVLTDGQLGQMMEPLQLCPDPPPPVPEKPWAVSGCRGRKPNMVRSLYLDEGDLEKFNIELQAKYCHIAAEEVRFDERMTEDCDVLIVAYGTSARIGKAAIEAARCEGLKVGLLRPVTLWPFPREAIARLSRKVRGILVVEMSAGQLIEDVELAVQGRVPVVLEGRMGGAVPTESAVLAKLRELAAHGAAGQ